MGKQADTQSVEGSMGDLDPESVIIGKLEAVTARLEIAVDKLEPRVRSLERWRSFLAGAWVILGAIVMAALKKMGCLIW